MITSFREKRTDSGQIKETPELLDRIFQNIHNCHQSSFESVEGIGELVHHRSEDYGSESEEEKKNCWKSIDLTSQTKNKTMEEIRDTIRDEMQIQLNTVQELEALGQRFQEIDIK